MHGPRSIPIPFLLVIAAIVTGCSSGPTPFDADPTFADWPEDRKLNDLRRRLAPQLRPGVEAETPPPLFETAKGPEPYIDKALKNNPALRSARRRIERLAARVPQAEGLDDPRLQVAPFGRMAETAAGEVGWMSSISQRLPHPDKLRGRSRVAAQEMAVATAEWQRQRLSVIAETRRAYWSLYYIARAIEVNQTNQGLLDQFRKIASARLRTGMANQEDVLRASVELNHLKNERTVLNQRRVSTVAMLNLLMDQAPDTALPSPKPIKLRTLSLKVQQLLDRAARHNPEIRKAEARLETFRERVELARLNRTPDLTVSANYVAVDETGLSPAANGRDQWWFGFGINLPLWNRRLDAADREARQGVLESVWELKNARNRIAYRIHDAWAKVEAQQKSAMLFEQVIVPEARQAVDASLSGYQSGKVGFLTLIDNWRKLMNFQRMAHRSLAQAQQELAALQEVIGEAPPANTQPENPEPQP